MTEDDLTEQFTRAFNKMQVPQDVVEDITETLKSSHRDKSEFHHSLRNRYQSQYNKYQTMIENAYDDKVAGSITESYYDKKQKEYRQKQKKIENKIAKLRFADEEYYITSEYLLKLASNASKLFESSEVEEKRQLLKLLLQNCKLKERKLQFTLEKPFDTILRYVNRSAWLQGRDSLRLFSSH